MTEANTVSILKENPHDPGSAGDRKGPIEIVEIEWSLSP